MPWDILALAAIWTWAIWSCAEHWLGNPNYSYGWVVPVLALGFGIRRYLMTSGNSGNERLCLGESGRWPRLIIAFALGGLAFLLEYARVEMWHPQIVLWSICLLAAISTIATLWIRSGRKLARAEIFPVLFFFTAAPWPPRFEQPLTGGLMRWVATVTVECLHWLGVDAQVAGGAIALPAGLVGITEACSGIRSLQAAIMFGLAVGEWFLLSWRRRALLFVAAIALAIVTNLVRTLALTLEVQRHGIDSFDRFHDLIGNIMITVLIVAIWLLGKLLKSRRPVPVGKEIDLSRARNMFRTVSGACPALFRAAAFTFVAGLFCARMLYAGLEARDRTQTTPFFVVRSENSKMNRLASVPRTVWNELHPTAGEYIRHENPNLPGGGADCFHFFWKPSPWNRFALVHRPDICMPGIGWELDEPGQPRDVEINGHVIRCYIFRFRRQNLHALELWGAWRNGKPVSIDYRPEQVLGAAAAPRSLDLEGKRRSATEIVACNIVSEGTKPETEMALALLPSVFRYEPVE